MKTNQSSSYPLFGIMNFGKNYSLYEANKKIHKDGNIITALWFDHDPVADLPTAKEYINILIQHRSNTV